MSIGIRLLSDIRDVFDGRDHLATADLLAGLHDIEEAPWGDFYGKPLSARSLARMLEPYRVRPQQRRVTGSPTRGYFAQDFADSWTRYVPVHEPATSGTPGTAAESVTRVPDVPGLQTGTEPLTLIFDDEENIA